MTYDHLTLDRLREITDRIDWARAQLVSAQCMAEPFQFRAAEIARKGASITGHPYRSDRLSNARLDGDLMRISIEEYAGEGEYVPCNDLLFPARWLAMPDEEWMAELRAEHERRESIKAAKTAARAERAREAERNRLRARLRELDGV